MAKRLAFLQRGASWVARVAASALLLWLVARRLDFSRVAHVWLSAQWPWLAAAIGLMLVNRVLSVSRVLWLMQANGTSFSPKQVSRIVLGSELIGSFLPGSVGCDGVRIVGLAQHTSNAPLAASVVFLERAIGLLALLAFVVAGALLAIQRPNERQLFSAALISSAVAFLFVVALLNERWVNGLIRWMGLHNHRLACLFQKWQQAVHAYGKQRRLLARVAAVSFIIQGFRVLSVYCVGQALSSGIRLVDVLIFVPVILLLAMLPISIGGLGVRENAFVHSFARMGVEPAAAFSVSLISHVLSVLANVPGGMWSLWGKAHASASDGKPQERMLRVLWVADKLGYGEHIHGVGGYYLGVLPALQRRCDVIAGVLRCHDSLIDQFSKRQVALRPLRRKPYDPRAIFTLVEIIRREKVDVLHVHGYGATMFGRIAGTITHKPVIVHQHDSTSRAKGLFRWIDRLLAPLTARAIAVSESVKVFCVAERGIAPELVHVLSNAVAAGQAPSSQMLKAWRRELNLPDEALLVGSITRFHPVKRVGYLINAMAQVIRQIPQAHLVLWGDGPEREMLRANVQALGLENQIHFSGYDPQASLRLPLLDCFALASSSEGQPFVILEALAAGIPIVATRVGGIPELLEEGKEGLLVPAEDPIALVEAIARVLSDKALSARLSSAARQAAQRYSIDRHAEQLQQFYSEVAR